MKRKAPKTAIEKAPVKILTHRPGCAAADDPQATCRGGCGAAVKAPK